MARNFDLASLQYYEYAGTWFSTDDVTFACWARPTLANTSMTCVQFGNNTANANIRLGIAGTPNNAIMQIKQDGSGAVNATATASVSVNSWNHLCGTYNYGTSFAEIYLNGGNYGSAFSNVSALNNTTIGVNHRNGSYGTHFDGDICEAAIWDVVLTADEAYSLSRGFSPLLIRPQNLRNYWPLVWKTNPELDLIGDFLMTPTNGPTEADQAPVFYPSSPFIGQGLPGSPAGPVVVPRSTIYVKSGLSI